MQILTDTKSISNESQFFELLPEKWGEHVDLSSFDLFVAAGLNYGYSVSLFYEGVHIATSVDANKLSIHDLELYEELMLVLGGLIGDAMPYVSEDVVKEAKTKSKDPKFGKDCKYYKIEGDGSRTWRSDVYWNETLKQIYEAYAKQHGYEIKYGS